MAEDTIPRVEVPLPAVSHMAFVVDDLEDSMHRFGRILGIEPWLVYRHEPPRLTNTTYRGEPTDYSMRVAITDVKGPVDLKTNILPAGVLRGLLARITGLRDRLRPGAPAEPSDDRRKPSWTLPTPELPGMNIELIEPLEGPSTYTEHLDANGDGIHHIGCFSYNDPHRVVRMYENAGIPVIQTGDIDGVEFWYLDMTREIDGLIFEVAANLWAMPEPDGVFPE